ncbi:MAG: DUF3881 family protein [Lachnospiraceae bacterium]|nr:DUF3881 family protein [Lachnospiraceae bacterium]
MHSYLRAIGFSNVKNRSDFEKILGMVMESPTEKATRDMENKIKFTEMKKDFLRDVGIGIVGEYDQFNSRWKNDRRRGKRGTNIVVSTFCRRKKLF